ncbi:MAG: hypothetical protein RR064_04120 [Oscillospiraceae bacterium]
MNEQIIIVVGDNEVNEQCKGKYRSEELKKLENSPPSKVGGEKLKLNFNIFYVVKVNFQMFVVP